SCSENQTINQVQQAITDEGMSREKLSPKSLIIKERIEHHRYDHEHDATDEHVTNCRGRSKITAIRITLLAHSQHTIENHSCTDANKRKAQHHEIDSTSLKPEELAAQHGIPGRRPLREILIAGWHGRRTTSERSPEKQHQARDRQN